MSLTILTVKVWFFSKCSECSDVNRSERANISIEGKEGARRGERALFRGKNERKNQKREERSDMWHFVSAAEPRARRAMIVPDHSSHEISLINPSFSKKPPPPLLCRALPQSGIVTGR